MEDSKIYSVHDIEKLKQKIATYRETLTAMKTGNSIDDYLFMKSEFNGFKTKISNLEGIMNEKKTMQIEEYKQQVKNFSIQIDSLDQTVKELNQDISLIMSKVSDGDDVMEETNAPVDKQVSVNIANAEEKVENLIEEPTQTKDQTAITSIQQPNRPLSFRQLQNLAMKANDIREAPSATPLAGLDIKDTYPEGQRFTKKRFPSTGSNPSHLYNGRYRSSLSTSVIHLNKFEKKQMIPIRVNENSSLPMSFATSDFEKNEPVMEYSGEVNKVASVDLESTSIEVFDEVSDFDPIDVNNTSIEISSQVNEITPIEVDYTPIEISNKMKRQQHNNKETFWLFNFFRKKH